MKKAILAISFLLVGLFVFPQKSVNNYKYIIVPQAFEFSKSEDQYQLNSLLEFLFNKYGYKAYLSNEELPEDLKNNKCLSLRSEVTKEKSGMFKTKLEIILKDCSNTEVMRSKIGESRLKEYKRAYSEALRDAFVTFQKLEYNYQPNSEVVLSNENKKTSEKPINIEESIPEPEAQTSVDTIDEDSDYEGDEVYYAQPKDNGYQLVDSEPKVVMFLLSTSAENVFMVKNKKAIVYKEKNQWIYFENNDGEIIEKYIRIKF